ATRVFTTPGPFCRNPALNFMPFSCVPVSFGAGLRGPRADAERDPVRTDVRPPPPGPALRRAAAARRVGLRGLASCRAVTARYSLTAPSARGIGRQVIFF